MRISWSVLATTLVSIGLVVFQARADIMIDNFNEGGVSVLVNDSSTSASDTDTGLATTNTIGGERLSVLTWEEGTANTTLQINQVGDNEGKASYSSDPSANGYFQLVYGNSSDLNADLSDANNGRFGIHFFFSDVLSTTTVMVATSGGGISTLSMPNPLGGTVDTWTYFDYGAFSGTADFNDVDKITITVTCTPGADITIDEIGTSPVPEPAAAGLMLLVGSGAFLYRRKSTVRG